MSRRVSLPGADELFRNTATLSAVPSSRENIEEMDAPVSTAPKLKNNTVRTTPRRRATAFDRAPSGREKHDEKITVYLSPDELYDLDQARLALRGDLGLAVDRGRIVRESLSIIIADLEAKGDQSIIARRLRGK
ncbi:MAG: hypothetical protein F2670_03710 [Actinobacteria bacterium]|jgi:hypothetical protein|uniref:Unannotated protein n=1 Tax=freshwater metagenome TaxID=449393 RepID=A0A6J6PUI0_9ZZZZ|nr:hypothetical protein [Actinomycetota bacterium]MSV65150.1 hypothetical protein [Actinomycetota bacterium]MSX69415.1 hypothetical protein [Actinomycetota bacterium]MSY16014.1 hypothetical protein [Actinomycetota bacterium]MSY64960.1 hypothetical protein [Actinomycetota bacterium]